MLHESPPPYSSSQKHVFGFFCLEKGPHLYLISKIQFSISTHQQVIKSHRLKLTNNSRTHQPTMAGDIDFVGLIHCLFAVRGLRLLRPQWLKMFLPGKTLDKS